MNDRDTKLAIAAGGLLLIVLGHRLMDAEFGQLGAPHALGTALVALALKT
jgi:hypothetical protein